jgi:hypothetical protein
MIVASQGHGDAQEHVVRDLLSVRARADDSVSNPKHVPRESDVEFAHRFSVTAENLVHQSREPLLVDSRM